MHSTRERLEPSQFPRLKRGKLDTLQVNLGYLCNQSCLHCHVNAGPTRKELMDEQTVEWVIQFVERQHIKTVDLTGGAPEMNPHFRHLVTRLRELNVDVIDRCNLTILSEQGYEDLAAFLADNKVQIVASLPCYSKENVDAQRGQGVFEKSITALQKLNQLGYGDQYSLDLVYNPQGAVLPPDQHRLEDDYKTLLKEQFGVVFNRLLTITNMPIQRFGSTLISKGCFDDYMALLKRSHQDENLEHVMCKSILSVDWQGRLYDCDFNQMLGFVAGAFSGKSQHISQCIDYDFTEKSIRTADHCYGCTAGSGSSCGGALTI